MLRRLVAVAEPMGLWKRRLGVFERAQLARWLGMGSMGDLDVLARLHASLRVRVPSCYRGCARQEKFERSAGQNFGAVLNSGVLLGSVSISKLHRF